MARTALLAGATGLTGARCLQRLLQDKKYTRVKTLTRRPLAHEEGKLVSLVTDFKDLGRLGKELAADDVYCCLGTTLKKAGSRAAFEAVDYHMVVDLARAARAAGAKQFIVISAAGTSASSPSFYSRVKARMESAVSDMGYATVHILRPSLLLGERSERRLGEKLGMVAARALKPALRGPLAKYAPVEADAVAAAMLQLAHSGVRGVHVHHLPL